MERVAVVRGSPDLAEKAKIIGGVDVNLCFQCGKCSSGCPVSYAADYTPSQLIHAIQLGLTDLVLNSKTFWLCVSCQTCSTRCPQDVDLAGVMDAVRIIAQREGRTAGVPEVSTFCQNSLRNINLFGRMYELGLIAMLKLSTGRFTKDMGIGFKMLSKGKLKILPSLGGTLAARRVFAQVRARERP